MSSSLAWVFSPVGLTVPEAWRNVASGCSGIRRITLFDASDEAWKVKIAGEAWGFDPLNYMSAKEARRADRTAQFSLAAAVEAVAHAQLDITPAIADDVGVIIGCGSGGIWTYAAQHEIMLTKGAQRMNPLLVPMEVVDTSGVQVGIRFGAHGPNFGIASACATGADSIGMAVETIKRGDARVMIAGGTEAAVHPLGIAGFDNLGALSRRNDSPMEASRPFDADRDGFVVSEGAAILILESLDFALARGAEPLVEILSYAGTSDGLHFTAPDESATQSARAMRHALAKAGVRPEEVDYANAHAAGTPVGDPLEVRAYRQMFGARLPPTINYHTPDPNCAMDCVPNAARPAEVNVALSAAFGFGGHNTVLVFRKYDRLLREL